MRLKVSNVCQLFNKAIYPATQTNKGVTFTNNGDGTITVNGTATDSGNAFSLQIVTLHKDHIYFLFANQNGSFANIVFMVDDLGSAQNTEGNFWKSTVEGEKQAYFWVTSGITISNRVYKLQLFDLTEMYGAGHEPTTVEQFRQDFPNEMYDYSPVCWKKFRRLKYIANKQPVQLYAKNIWKEYTDLYGVSIKNNNDGSITLNGTATQTFYYTNRLDYEIKPNHKYLYFDYYPQTPSWDTYVGGCEGKVDHEGPVQFAIYNMNNDGTIDPSSSTLPSNTLLNTFCMCYKGFTFNNITIKPQFFDLTEMYGEGNEPTTVAQFRVDFPNELYDYNLYNYLTLNRGKYIANKQPVQLLDKSKVASNNIAGVTYTNNGDGTWTVNGTSTGPAWSNDLIPDSKSYNLFGHKLLWLVVSDDDNIVIEFKYVRKDGTGYGFSYNRERIYTFTEIENYDSFQIRLITLKTGVTFTNTQAIPQLFDLTAIYGAGNEPTTVAQFRADYPNALYDYNPYNAITFR